LRKDVAYFLEENSLLMFGEVQADYFINEKSIELKNDTKSMGNFFKLWITQKFTL